MADSKNIDGPLLICDLRKEWNGRPYVTFWRPNDANYAYPLVWAGDYTEQQALEGGSYYTTFEDGILVRFPISRSVVEALAVQPKPGIIDGDTGPVVRNTRTMRNKLRSLAFAPAVSRAEGRS